MQDNYEFLGPVVLTQIHTDRMVQAGVYRSELLSQVDELWLGADGVVGSLGDRALLHAHHRCHPNKLKGDRPRDFLPNRLVSIGFTSHYRMVEVHFGWNELGIAAEDIVVECARPITEADLAAGLQFRRTHSTLIGGQSPEPSLPSRGTDDAAARPTPQQPIDTVGQLGGLKVAKPCVPFTRFMLKDPDPSEGEVRRSRAFLDGGMRGFVGGLEASQSTFSIKTGDQVWRRVL